MSDIGYGGDMAINPETTVRKLVSFPHETISEIQDFRFAKRISSEAETIRRLVALGLAADPIIRDLLAFLEQSGDDTDPATRSWVKRLRGIVG